VAREVRKFSVTIPPGTAIAAPQVTALVFPPRVIQELQILIPPGPRGNVGFQIAQAGGQVFPTEPGAFFVSDNERITWPVEEANTSGAWQLIAYNLGTFAHTLEVRFLVALPPGAGAELSPAFIEADVLSQ